MKNRRYLFSLALCAIVLFVNMLSAQFAGGNGTEEEPYLVETVSHLNNVRFYPDAYFLQIDDIDLSLFYGSWNPIGDITPSSFNPFSGRYDGNGFYIDNLEIYTPTGNFVGLFGIAKEAELRNIILRNVDIQGGLNSIIGSLAGIVDDALVDNCRAEGGSITGNDYLGGLVGVMISSDPYYKASDTPDNTEEDNDKPGKDIFVGRAYIESIKEEFDTRSLNGAKMNEPLQSSIQYSYADISVTGANYIGGLVGYQYRSIVKNSFALNEAVGNDYVGGLTGFIDYYSIVENCFARGSVDGYDSVGGLAGLIAFPAAIAYSYSTGYVEGVTPNTGGLLGYCYQNSTIINSYWDIMTSGMSTSASGQGRTTLDMIFPYSTSTYVGWDMKYVWASDTGIPTMNDGYPFLFGILDLNDIFDGSGTAQDPYLVDTPLKLSLINSSSTLSKHFLQTDDISLIHTHNSSDGKGWLPIGSIHRKFRGTYDGDGYQITDLYIDREDTDYVGLFGCIEEAQIKNIDLRNSSVKGNDEVGSLVGYSLNSDLRNISVDLAQVRGNVGVGGVIGLSKDSRISVINSSTDMNIVNNVDLRGDEAVGGVIGRKRLEEENILSYVETLSANNIFIMANNLSSSNGRFGGVIGSSIVKPGLDRKFITVRDVTVDFVRIKGDEHLGGLIGYSYQTLLSNIRNHNMLPGTLNILVTDALIDGDSNLGGLVGTFLMSSEYPPKGMHEVVPTIYRCKVEDSIIGHTSANTNIGGLVGRVNNAYMNNCNSADVIVSGNTNIGGLVGEYSQVRIVDVCESVGVYPYGYVKGEENVGGLIGYVHPGDGGSVDPIVAACSSSIDVFNSGPSIEGNIGGVIGYSNNTAIEGCVANNSITVSNTANIGGLIGLIVGGSIRYSSTNAAIDVTGSTTIGGLVGNAYRGIIQENYSKGDITINNSDTAGGLIGKIKGQGTSLAEVHDSYSESSIYTTNSCEYLGGLVASVDSTCIIEKSYATGSILKSTSSTSNNYSGGLIGYLGNDTTVINTYACGKVEGGVYTGGLVGYFNGSDSCIESSYSIGKVGGSSFVGGLIGEVSLGNINNSYWDTVTSRQNSSAGGTGLMTISLVRNQSYPYSNWDFSTTWSIDNYTTYPSGR